MKDKKTNQNFTKTLLVCVGFVIFGFADQVHAVGLTITKTSGYEVNICGFTSTANDSIYGWASTTPMNVNTLSIYDRVFAAQSPTDGCKIVNSNNSQQYIVVAETHGGSPEQNLTQYVYYLQQSGFFTILGGDVVSNATRIISMSPENGSTTATTNVSFSFSSYISETDAANGVGVRIYLQSLDQTNLEFFSQFSGNDKVLFDARATTAGEYDFATTTYLPQGNYRFFAQLIGTTNSFLGYAASLGCIVEGGFLNEVCVQGNTQFKVVQGSFLGNIQQTTNNEITQIFASTTATSSQALAKTCVPWSGSFDTLFCITYLFVPDSTFFPSTIENLKNNVLTHFPLGYVTDFFVIFATTTATDIPVIDATVPSVLPGGGAHIYLSVTHILDPVLNATAAPYGTSTETLYQVTESYWDKIVYIGVALYILYRIIGAHLFGGSAGISLSHEVELAQKSDYRAMGRRIYEHKTKE